MSPVLFASVAPLLAAATELGGEEENTSYLVTPDRTAIVWTVIVAVMVVLAVVLLVRYLRRRT